MRPTMVRIEDLTPAQLIAAKAIHATDGIVSTVLWENPIRADGESIFVFVEAVIPEYFQPIQRQITRMLILSEHPESA